MKFESEKSEYEQLVATFERLPVAVFCGAGISIDPPAGIPDWNKLRDFTLEVIASKDEIIKTYLDNLTSIEMIASPGKKGMTPELVASEILKSCQGYFESFRALEDGEPNANHRYLAKMAKAGNIHYILTTNFDLFIERALEQEGLSYHVYRTEEEFEVFEPESNKADLHLLKIHGCISVPSTITATVEQEGKGLSPLKARALEKLLKEYLFVFWGYSGSDLKIDIDYLRMKSMKDVAKGFVWNFYQRPDLHEPPSPYVVTLLELYGEKGMVVYGMLPEVFDTFVGKIERIHFTDTEIKGWSERKNSQLLDSLRDWANLYIDSIAACNIFGSLLLYSGQPQKALACYQRMAQVSGELGDLDALGAAFNNIGNVYKSIGDHIQALLFYKKAEKIARERGLEQALVYYLGNIGDVCARLGSHEDAMNYYKEAREKARKLGDRGAVSHLLDSMGDIYKGLGKYDEALQCYDEAQGIIRELGFKQSLGQVLDKIGIIYRMWGEYEKALEYFQETEQIDRALGDKPALSYALDNIGSIHLAQKESEKALASFQEAEKIAQETEDKRALARVFNDIGTVYLAKDQYEEALNHLLQAEHIDREVDEPRNLGFVLQNIGTAYSLQHKHDMALKYRKEALTVLESVGDRATAAVLSQDLGSNYAKELHRPAEAIGYFEKSLSLYRNAGLDNYVPEILHEIATCRQMISSQPMPSLFNILSDSVQKEASMEDAFRIIASSFGLTTEQFELKAFCESLEHQYGTEEAAYRILLNINKLCNDYRDTARYTEAVQYYTGAEIIASEIYDKHSVSVMMNNTGLIYMDQSKFEEALKCFQQAEQIAREIDDKHELATRLYNIGSVYKDQDEDEALRYFVEAEKVTREVEDRQKLCVILESIATIYQSQRKYDNALQYYSEVEQLVRDTGNIHRLALVLLNMGKILRDSGQFHDALQYRLEALEMLETLGDLSTALRVNLLIANEYENDLRMPESAIPYYEKSIVYLQDLGQENNVIEVQRKLEVCRQKIFGGFMDDTTKSTLYDMLCNAAGSKEEADVALEITAQGLQFPRDKFEPLHFSSILEQQYGKDQALGMIFENIGRLLKTRKEFEEALNYFYGAAQIARQIGNKPWLGNLFMNIGDVYYAQQKPKEALERYKESEQLARESNNKTDLDTVLYKIASVYEEESQYSEALKFYQASEQIAREIDNQQGLGVDLYKIGLMYTAQSNYPDALRSYSEAEQIFRRIGNKHWLGNVLNNTGDVYFQQEKFEESLKYFQEAEQIAREIDYQQGLRIAQDSISLVQKKIDKHG